MSEYFLCNQFCQNIICGSLFGCAELNKRLTDGVEIVSHKSRPRFIPHKHFLLQASLTPGPYCGWEYYVDDLPI
jgi:hypothetical protein